MFFRLASLLLLLLPVCILPAHAGGKNSSKAAVSFHIETEATDNPKMIFPQTANGQTRYFRRMAEITIKDITAFTPFPSEFGGDDYGLVFTLKNNAARRLAAITNAHQGRWMISQINGRVIDGFLIDQEVNDGKIVIWKGVTLADIAIFDETLPRIGQD